MGNHHYSGQICQQTGLYGQYSDATGIYAGAEHDRHVQKGSPFPPSINNHHWRLKQ